MISEPILDIDQIQANILPGFRLPHMFFIAGKVKNKTMFARLLSDLLPEITTMREAIGYHSERIEKAKEENIFGIKSFSLTETKNLFWLNISFGSSFLRNYNSDAENVDSSFKVGLAASSFLLGDPRDPSAKGNKTNWLFGNESTEADFFLITGSDNIDYLNERCEDILRMISMAECEIIYSEHGNRLENDIEHFGFKDGISQPAVRGYIDQQQTFFDERKVIKGNENPDAPEYASPGDILIWPGQFVFGYDKQSRSHFRTPVNPSDNERSLFLRNGSFLVFRRLEQDVKSFLDETKRLHNQLISVPEFQNMLYEEFVASFVGRYKDGKPIIIDGQNASHVDFNNFNYKADTREQLLKDGTILAPIKADPEGLRCPMFAHIRKVNPRDKNTDQGGETNTQFFRILRRGIPFGPPYDSTTDKEEINTTSRGLHFLCYQTSIKEQFELLSSKWMNEESRPEAKKGFDAIVGQNNEEDGDNKRWCMFVNEAGNSKRLETNRNFVIPTGGGYFFCPSIDSIQKIIDFITGEFT